MNAQIYNIMLEDSADIAGFFRNQPGGKLCLALIFDIFQKLVEEGNIGAIESAVETVYEVCEMPRPNEGINVEWVEVFLEMIGIQFPHKS